MAERDGMVEARQGKARQHLFVVHSFVRLTCPVVQLLAVAAARTNLWAQSKFSGSLLAFKL